jgi:hypothetical protein
LSAEEITERLRAEIARLIDQAGVAMDFVWKP